MSLVKQHDSIPFLKIALGMDPGGTERWSLNGELPMWEGWANDLRLF